MQRRSAGPRTRHACGRGNRQIQLALRGGRGTARMNVWLMWASNWLPGARPRRASRADARGCRSAANKALRGRSRGRISDRVEGSSTERNRGCVKTRVEGFCGGGSKQLQDHQLRFPHAGTGDDVARAGIRYWNRRGRRTTEMLEAGRQAGRQLLITWVNTWHSLGRQGQHWIKRPNVAAESELQIHCAGAHRAGDWNRIDATCGAPPTH